MKICPKCGGTDVVIFDANNDLCNDCRKWFPAIAEAKEVYCHECSKSGGAEKAIYHLEPVCKSNNMMRDAE